MQIIRSKEQYFLYFSIVKLPKETHLAPMSLCKKWVNSLIGPSSPNLHTQEEGRKEVDNNSYEENQNETKPICEDTLEIDSTLESFFYDQPN